MMTGNSLNRRCNQSGCQPNAIQRQRGVVLVISMIMILLLTSIGLAGMRSARLETIMAQNLQQKVTSFNHSESAAAVGEAEWDGALVACKKSIQDCPDDVLARLTPAILSSIHELDWNANEDDDADNDNNVEPVLIGNDEIGKYYVEYLGWRDIGGEGHKFLHIYRISAYATDDTGTSKTLIQTIYRRCLKPDGVPCPD